MPRRFLAIGQPGRPWWSPTRRWGNGLHAIGDERLDVTSEIRAVECDAEPGPGRNMGIVVVLRQQGTRTLNGLARRQSEIGRERSDQSDVMDSDVSQPTRRSAA
jgi:hypothetical protein